MNARLQLKLVVAKHFFPMDGTLAFRLPFSHQITSISLFLAAANETICLMRRHFGPF
jgi:hypothetical protein